MREKEPERPSEGTASSREGIRPEVALRRIAEGISTGAGSRLFESIALHLAEALGMEIAVLAEIEPGEPRSARTLAYVVDGIVREPITYELAGTPCEGVTRKGMGVWPEGVQSTFPEDAYLGEHGIESCIGTPLRSAQGQVIGLISAMSRRPLGETELATDILRILALRASGEMERLAAEKRLASSEEVHRTVLSSSVEGICGMEVNGTLTLVNRAAGSMLGFDPDELLGKNFFSIVAPPDSGSDLAEVPNRGSGCAGEALFRRRDGQAFPVEYVVSPMRDGDRPIGWVVSFLEVTQRRALELQLEQANRISGLGKLAASVAHEFNNVLMGIQPFAQIVERESSLNPRLGRAARSIRQAVQRGKRITDEILRYARPLDLTTEPVEVARWLDDISAELRVLLPPNIRFSIETDENDLWIEADRSQIEQVVVNLATNAADAMPDGGTFTIAARAGASYLDVFEEGVGGYDYYVHFTFKDDGHGIAPDDLPFIFEPLFTTKRKGKGTGLGLAVVQRLVAAHQGKLFVESRSGEGTTFHLLLPAAAPAASRPDEATTVKPGRRIVLVEDDPVVGSGLSELLRSEGFEVSWVQEGLAVEGAVSALDPDLLLLDLRLPDVDGITVLRGLRKSGCHVPVLISTAHEDDFSLTTDERTHLLPKPYDFRTLMNAMQKLDLEAAPN